MCRVCHIVQFVEKQLQWQLQLHCNKDNAPIVEFGMSVPDKCHNKMCGKMDERSDYVEIYERH